MILFNILLVIIIVILFIKSINKNTIHAENNIRAYGEKHDDIKSLLNRIEWSSNYSGRVNYFIRYLFYSLFITLFVGIVMLNKIPKPMVYCQSAFACWFCLISLHGYMTHHCDKYHDYAIKRNVKLLKKKLNISKYILPKSFTKRFSVFSEPMNFVYD